MNYREMINQSIDSDIKDQRRLVEYIDLLYRILGVDIDFDKFKNMTTSEKQTFIRDIKINKILDNVIPKN